MTRTALLIILFITCLQPLAGQICTGSLGDPIINITFGSGSNPGPPLTAATTSYQFANNDCPSDGFYTVRNSSNNCHGGTWHSITDRTGNANGYFMLVNASIEPSAFYIDTVRGLCGNTTYEFAAWVVNMLKPSACSGNGIRPNLTFRMERTNGLVLQSFNTNDILPTNNPEWKQYGFFFTTPMNVTDVVIRIINNAQGGCGNDLALDDITFRPCGPQITTSIVGVTGNTATHCQGTAASYTLAANLSIGFNSPVVQWQQRIDGGAWTDIAGATGATLVRMFGAGENPASYQYRLTAAEAGNMNSLQCRVASVPLNISIGANPVFSINTNSPVCAGRNVSLSVNSATANWSGPNGFNAAGSQQSLLNAQVNQSGKYYVQVQTAGCSRTDSVNVIIHPSPSVQVINGATICSGDSLLVTVTGADDYSWTPSQHFSQQSAGLYLFYPAQTTPYKLTGSNQFNCTDSAFMQLVVQPPPIVQAGPDKLLIQGQSIRLDGSVTGDSVQVQWWPPNNVSNTNILTPSVQPASDVIYVLTGINQYGCFARDTVLVKVFDKIIIPNAFSPNGDGLNDEWRIAGLESYAGAAVTVFNRFGQAVFSSRQFRAWNGTYKSAPVPVGTYYYVIALPLGFAPISGWLQLLR